jgi:2-hydroxy-3-keto-5-methylthiopentenyl-1-phosphate phosphatase
LQRLHLFCDFDGTITQHDTLVYLATQLGAGPDFVNQVGEEIRLGRMTLREAIEAEIRTVRLPFPEVARILRQEIALDPGFAGLAEWSRSQSIPLTILSAGFQEIIELFVPQVDYPWIEVIANRVDPDPIAGWQCHFRDPGPYGTDKRKHLSQAQQAGAYCLFVGDGFSDREAAETADRVFAKHSLALYCRERAIPFDHYATLEEVRAFLVEEGALPTSKGILFR